MIDVYDLKGDGERRLSANFTVAEFACRDGSRPVFVDAALVTLLQALRDRGGRPLVINSAYRTPAHNAKVGGVTNSQHLYGRAADIQMEGVPPQQLAEWAEELMPDSGGIGVYPPKPGRPRGWVHVDTRKKKSRWTL